MSEIGNISKSYGKQVSISVANTYSSNVLNSTLLPAQSIIIAAPIITDSSSISDVGTYCLVATDANKVPVRLTYTLQPGNGLVVDNDNTDILKLSIDETTLKVGEGGYLQLNTAEMIDNSTLGLYNDKISVDTQSLQVADEDTFGVVSIDGESTKLSINSNLYVDTESLTKANQNAAGVVTSDNNTIYIDSDGVVSVNTENLETASQSNYGVAKIDGKTLKSSSNGSIYVDTSNLGKGNANYYGIVRPDNRIVNISNGTLYIDTDSIQHATPTTYGTIMIDGVTLVSKDGIVSMPKYDALLNSISTCSIELNKIENSINQLNEKLSQLV